MDIMKLFKKCQDRSYGHPDENWDAVLVTAFRSSKY